MSDKKSHYIKLLRKNGFNCFPIPRRSKDSENQKGADSRYQARRTKTDQPIKSNENYGYMARVGYKNCVIDIDSKEYESQVNEIAKKYMVIKSGKGFHIPVIDLFEDSSKIELFDYSRNNKKIIEIQGVDHYVMGIESVIYHQELQEKIKYENIGTEKFLSANNQQFDLFVDDICNKFHVQGKKKTKQQHYEMRQRFKQGLPPSKSTSNDYFFNAGIQCLTDGLTQNEASEKIREVYSKWENPTRQWSNIEAKIRDVYENGEPIKLGRQSSGFDRTEIAQRLIRDRNLFSDYVTKGIYENKQGFLEPIEQNLIYELQKQFPNMEDTDFKSILFKLIGLSQPIPKKNKDLIVFKNGIYSISKGRLLKTKEIKDDDIAYSGFKDHDYIQNPNPKKFLKLAFENIPKDQHENLESGFRGILKPILDSKISVIQGNSGTGKSAVTLILHKLLSPQYSMVIDNSKLIKDPASRIELKDKLLVVIQELPQVWNEFDHIKRITGDKEISERGNFRNLTGIENTIKFFATVNNLPRIPTKDENAMFGRRLSLMTNTKKTPYPQNDTFEDEIIESEGDEILSYLANLTSKNPSYMNGLETKRLWKSLANPELEYIERHFRSANPDEVGEKIPLQTILKELKKQFPDQTITVDDIVDTCKEIGINVFARCLDNVIRIETRVKQEGLVV